MEKTGGADLRRADLQANPAFSQITEQELGSATATGVCELSECLVVRFTNNVVVSGFLLLRQRKLLKSAATHVLANPSNPVE